ncbi:MAG TPA: hypothetical protein H9906_02695 [Candidatus Paenalcaligenes intestinipullorum]|uniref:Uncharacterized protein n=1 Tax=Candidatus Paenalcaligenes intestinipullorum TaxID=2838718 RepID=A0A9D2U8P5_9BURK|nr:hypothetical protein [Candidatus Paenalcaligenes intestinipullorum]
MGRRQNRRKPAFEIEPLNWVAPQHEDDAAEQSKEVVQKDQQEAETPQN